MRRHVMTYRSSDISDMFIVMRRQGKNWPSWKEWQDKEGNITTLQRQSQSHLRHWLQFWQLRPSIHDNLCYLTIKSDTGQHSQFLQCFHVSGLKTVPCLSSKVYTPWPRNLDELEANITKEVNQLDPAMMTRALGDMKKRAQLCLAANGGHFEKWSPEQRPLRP